MIKLEDSKGYRVISEWLSSRNMEAFLFQRQAWQHITEKESGLVNAPTGCGKT